MGYLQVPVPPLELQPPVAGSEYCEFPDDPLT